jgi:exosortase A-associated hydrolase 2
LKSGAELLKGVFIDGGHGRLFCTLRLPSCRGQSAIMVVPAFGDEMNKTRRMLTETAKELSESGIAVVIPDLFGTGDSGGSFAEASWATWISDLSTVAEWASSERLSIRGLVAVRTGALLAAEFAKSYARGSIVATVFWQPVTRGSVFVRQSLRVRTLATAVNSGAREIVDELIARIRDGEVIFAGGYPFTKATIEPLMAADLSHLVCDELGDLHGVEVTRIQERCGDYAEVFGARHLAGIRYLGEPYWNSTETVCDINVVARTAELLRNRVHALGE